MLLDIQPEELHLKMQDPNFLNEAQLIDVREPEEVYGLIPLFNLYTPLFLRFVDVFKIPFGFPALSKMEKRVHPIVLIDSSCNKKTLITPYHNYYIDQETTNMSIIKSLKMLGRRAEVMSLGTYFIHSK